MDENLLIVIAGPTACGKTSLAIQLARYLNTEIISADSRQIYREMSIGTAKPSAAELSAVKHHFIGSRSVTEYYNASLYEMEVLELLHNLFKKHKPVIITGGSGLYINAVCNGIDDFPTVDPAVRKKLKDIYRETGLPGVQTLLKQSDEIYYQKVDLNNPQRILKALEIIEITGKPYSAFLNGRKKKRDFRLIRIGLDLPRPELHERINKRVDYMLKNGLLGEIQELYPLKHFNALNTVGYKELFSYMDGQYTLEEAVERVKAHTRQYARRQLTWFRKEKDMKWFHPENIDGIKDFIAHNSVNNEC